MPIKSQARMETRRKEIVAACAKLYETMSFREITIKEIAHFTSFTRPSIYNYFQTKEEIFLAFLENEYQKWSDELENMQPTGKASARDEFAESLARSLSTRQTMLKLLSLNLNDMEMNSSIERLVDFKLSYGRSLKALEGGLMRFFPEMSQEARIAFIYAFCPFLYGVYPYTVVSDMQREAMEKADIPYQFYSISKLVQSAVKQLLPA